MKGQFLFRQLENDVGSSEQTVHAAVGIVEMKPNTFVTETYHSFLMYGCNMQITDDRFPFDSDLDLSDLADTLTSMKFTAPAANSGLAGGMIAFRETRIPASQPGMITYLSVIAVRGAALIEDDLTIFELHGKGNNMLLSPTHKIDFNPAGEAITTLHKSPIWGFEDEKWGPVSTMRLDVIDKCDAYFKRQLTGEAHPEGTEYWIRTIVQPFSDDHIYKSYVESMFEKGLCDPWSAARSASRQKEIEKQSSEIIQKLLAA